MPIMAIYEITEAQTNLILVSTPTNLAIAVLLTPNATRQLKKLARKTLISVQLAPISESCPNLTPVQESLSCSGDNFGPESFIKPCTSDFFRVAGWFSRTNSPVLVLLILGYTNTCSQSAIQDTLSGARGSGVVLSDP